MPDIVRFVLRLPTDIHQELRAWAEQEDRSLHSLLLHIVRRALKEWRQ